MNGNHTLVVGGSGMLAEVVTYLCRKCQHVTVICRDFDKMKILIERHPKTCNALIVDYRDEEALSIGLKKAVRQNGPFNQVIAWVHRDAGKAMQVILDYSVRADVVHILGSQANPEYEKEILSITRQQSYRQVQLGAIFEKNTRRWLTHEEIVRGVIDAIEHPVDYRVIGQVDHKGDLRK
ncbi:short-chain dehydrogenase [Exiguobacterium qingdaonense]|uniref:short-chain dehydrogenase n=1 Tax=Exiguobacterium qingdaonense TaxID=2751251 RepID=UPI001BEC520C|nr:short-chain dehydrogenase [Exiguobacterium qingdaonense]